MSPVKRAVGSIGARFAPREARRSLSRGATASVAVVSGWLFFNLLAYGSLLIPAGEEESLLAKRSSSAPRDQRIASLPNTPFFGRAPVKTEKQPEVDLTNIPITQLNLVLSGVLDNSSKDKASALVAEKGKPAQRLYVGDTLPGGAELYSVAVDHIILRRNGRMEKLTYPDEDGRPSVPLRNFTNYASQAAAISEASEAGRGEKQQSIRERLEELRKLARERRAEHQTN
ncbi:Type IV pilus biogenesis [Microbulbifer donghaiensis]|uniref:Type IV pilus biogenesis n=1 Tax=Microbulbifer donghaiensis TaxID=494016 RepID=A0A1M4UF02_9GAMM|nr:type II secretion system protein N [Microbulbifer donghaiensis]SHE55140.1 Type IV pilus biogenesis [Microbulbifer donghaiensis]